MSMHFDVFVHGGRKLKEITLDGFSFLTQIENKDTEHGESRSESPLLIHSFRN